MWLTFLGDYWYAALFWLFLIAIMVVVYNRIEISGPQLKNRLIYYVFGIIALPLIAFFTWGGMRGGFRDSTRPITLSNAGEYVKDAKDISIVLNTPFAIFRTWGKTNLQKMSFYSEDELEKVYTNEIAQQIDIMPTVLGYLYYDKPYIAFGRVLFKGMEVPFALNYKDNVYQYFEGEYLLQFDGKKSAGLYNIVTDKLMTRDVNSQFPAVSKAMQEEVKALIQQYNNRMIDDKLTVE